MKRIIWSVAMTLFCALHAFADIQFSVSADKTTVGSGEQIVITAQIVSSEDLGSLSAPDLPSSENYTLLRTNRNQSHSTSVQLINGKMVQKREITHLFHYVISPQKTGRFTFPALEFTHKGKTYRSRAFPINVGAQPQRSQNVRVNLRPSRRTLYIGEQATLTVEILQKVKTPVNLTQEGINDYISSLKEALGKHFSAGLLSTNLTRAQKQVGGELFQAYSLSFSIIPLSSGTISIPAIPFAYEELRQSGRRGRADPFFDDFFGGGFFGSSVERNPRSTSGGRLSFTVKPLPAAPADFSGAVGSSFSLHADVDPKSVSAGEAVTLKIALKGNCRPGNLGDIHLPQLDDFDVFTPEKHTYLDTTSYGFVTRKTYKYLLIPQQMGEYTIPALSWSYFDPREETFRTLQTKPVTLDVQKGSGKPSAQSRYLTQEDIRQVGKDILYIKTPPRIVNQSPLPHRSIIFFILYPVPFLLGFFSVLYSFQAKRREKDQDKIGRQRALRKVFKQIHSLRKERPEASVLADRIATVTEEYLSNRFAFPAAGRTIEGLQEELKNRAVSQDLTDKLAELLYSLDQYRFGGIKIDQHSADELLTNFQTLLSNLEQAAKKGART
ncbi:MAG: BatD family protein [Chitinispirillaceae bacterium]